MNKVVFVVRLSNLSFAELGTAQPQLFALVFLLAALVIRIVLCVYLVIYISRCHLRSYKVATSNGTNKLVANFYLVFR